VLPDRGPGKFPAAIDALLGVDGACEDDSTCEAGQMCENGECKDLCDLDDPPELFIPQFSPQATGPYVNFESPQVRPVALTSDGETLLVTNTPAGTLDLFDASNATPAFVASIPVGIDPVTVVFEPGTGDQMAWVANMISDDISIVDVANRKVVEILSVGDEPVNIVFANGHAFVIVQGRGDSANFDSTHPEQGFVVVVNTSTRQIVGETFLALDTPRAAAYDPLNNQLLVAALHSGNSTTTIGAFLVLLKDLPIPANPTNCEETCDCDCVGSNVLEVARDFSLTAPFLAGDPVLGPNYPDVHDDPAFPLSAPLVHRIVPDIGGAWQDILDVLVDGNGTPLPGVAEQMTDELNLVSVDNANDIIEIMNENLRPQRADRDIVVVDVSDPTVSPLPLVEELAGHGTTLTGMARNPANGRVFVSNMEPHNLTRLEPNLKGVFLDNEILVFGPPLPDRSLLNRVDLVIDAEPAGDPGAIDAVAFGSSLANPLDVVFDPEANVGYVLALGPGRVGALDGTTGTVLGRVDVGRGPRGLALDADRNRLFVINRTDMSLMTVDVADPNSMAVTSVTRLFNPEPINVTAGRHFLYGTEFSMKNDVSCASCHIDGDKDAEIWDLGNPAGPVEAGPPNMADPSNHPLKGPMATQTLKGMASHLPLHWRGDKVLFQDFNAAFEGLLGGSQLDPSDMDLYNDFIMTVVFPPNPYYNRDGKFLEGDEALKGGCQFVTRCDPCHQLIHDGSFPTPDGDGGIDLSGINLQKTLITQMRDLHSKFPEEPTTHDWREGKYFEGEFVGHPMEAFLRAFGGFTQQQRDEMIAFVTAFQANVSPATGWQVMTVGQANRFEVDQALLIMLVHHSPNAVLPSQNDIVAHVHTGGSTTGYYLVSDDPPMFQSDTNSQVTADDLFDSIAATDSMVLMAVPSGSGQRIGIDSDIDCLSNGLDAEPTASNKFDSNGDGFVDEIDFVALVTCAGGGVSVPAYCALFDDDCDGSFNDVDFQAFFSAYEGDLVDCNTNGSIDLLDILDGTSVDNDVNAIPDECPAPHPRASGSRYISIQTTGNQPLAIQISDPSGCFVRYVGEDGSLRNVPVFKTPEQWLSISAFGRRMVPLHRYQVRVETEGGMLSAAVHETTWRWGDVDGNSLVNLADILFAADAFVGATSPVTLEGADQYGPTGAPDQLITLDDLLATLDAFAGRSFPGLEPCE
jgi:YVTN family beta-propeller protein